MNYYIKLNSFITYRKKQKVGGLISMALSNTDTIITNANETEEAKATTRKVPRIYTWKPKKSQILVERDGKIFICHFDKITGIEKYSALNNFIIKKESYKNQLDCIVQYINFFMNVYDTDNELAIAYLKLKYEIDKQRHFNKDNMDALIEFIYDVIFTPTMVEKIRNMVFDNYLDDIENTSDDNKKKYKKNEKKHLESLEFTNMHIKVLLRISMGIKIISPVLFHYVAKNNIKLTKDSDVIFRFFYPLFGIFGTAETYDYFDKDGNFLSDKIKDGENEVGDPIYRKIEYRDLEPRIKSGELTIDKSNPIKYKYVESSGNYYEFTEVNMYNKLYVYVKAKVSENNSNNSPIYSQREIFGTDLYSVINSFTRRVLISENMVKYRFGSHWNPTKKKYDENIVGMNKAIIKYQLMYFLKEQYAKNLSEVTNVKNSDGLSGLDKMEMNLSKIDEGIVTMAELNIPITLNYIKRNIDVDISKEEIDYYMMNLSCEKIITKLVFCYFAKYFGSCRDLNLLDRRQFIELLLILKKKLLLEFGYYTDDDGRIHSAALPYILTGNMSTSLNTRMIRNTKFITKVKESPIYEDIVANKFSLLEYIRPEEFLSIISSLVSAKFTYVTYEQPEITGTEIHYSDDRLSNEILTFLSSI